MSHHDALPHYRAYLLRLWAERTSLVEQPPTWRFSLEDPHTGDRRGYATLDALIDAVRHDMACDGDDPPPGLCP